MNRKEIIVKLLNVLICAVFVIFLIGSLTKGVSKMGRTAEIENVCGAEPQSRPLTAAEVAFHAWWVKFSAGDERLTVNSLTHTVASKAWCWAWEEADELQRKAKFVDVYTKSGVNISTLDWDELLRKAALWDEHGYWRAPVHLVRLHLDDYLDKDDSSYCWREVNGEELPYTEYLARAFVRTARELELPLWLPVAVAEWETRESPFSNNLVGKAGEVSLMQVKPFPNRPMEKIKADPAFAIRWAMEALFAPTYHKDGLREALLHYNRSGDYADAVTALGAKYCSESKLWAEIPNKEDPR